ncbi:MAG TPA: response regulator transcription factor [Cryptosporangiaceae bacterium]|nr:response regulator transcription factor [Cryptosporangiaceae bacterium]
MDVTAIPHQRSGTPSRPVRPTRVLIVDDHPMVREGLRAMLSRRPAVEVVGESGDLDSALELVETLQPDVVLLDLKLGRENALDACPEVARRSPDTKVIVLTMHDDDMHVFEALRCGARGYLLKGVPLEPLVQAIMDVRMGKTVLDPAVGGRLAVRAAHRGGARDWPGSRVGLSRRESEVLQEMTKGRDNHGIAKVLYISEDTVKTHVKAVFRKLGAHDRAHAVAIALRNRVVH